jgi:hypothetical protein
MIQSSPVEAAASVTSSANSVVKPPRKVAAAKTGAKSPARKAATAAKKPVARKTATRPAAKVAAPASAKTAVKAVKEIKSVEPVKVKAPKKPKLVRDSFTMPKDEYQAIETLKLRSTGLKRSTKKSELLRAGIMALSAMNDKDFAAILAKVPTLKTGRPSQS